MPKGRKAKQSPLVISTPPEPRVWLLAEYEFASTFSYRIPGASSQFAVGSPVPSPAAVKLALVDAAIRWSGSVNEGKRIFDMVKTARVCLIPPRRVARFRAFIKRLKPDEIVICPDHPAHRVSAKRRKSERPPCPWCGKTPDQKIKILTESTSVRDYFLLDGPLAVYIEVPSSASDEFRDLLHKIRRLGTTDSLCWCLGVREEEPPAKLCPVVTSHSQDSHGASTTPEFPIGFPVRLTDLTAASDFNSFNPFLGGGRSHHLCQEIHVLPLQVVRSGEIWAIFERVGG